MSNLSLGVLSALALLVYVLIASLVAGYISGKYNKWDNDGIDKEMWDAWAVVWPLVLVFFALKNAFQPFVGVYKFSRSLTASKLRREL